MSTQHAPIVPSRLRNTTAASPVNNMARQEGESTAEERYTPLSSPLLKPQEVNKLTEEPEDNGTGNDGDKISGGMTEPTQREADARTRLLEDYHKSHHVCGSKNCNHGTFSPRISGHRSNRSSISSIRGFGGKYAGGTNEDGEPNDTTRGFFGDSITDTFSNGNERDTDQMSTTKWLAVTHGITHTRAMYLSYYFPFLRWIRQYQWRWFQGDLIAALTMASFYIPMSLSYASNLGHIPPINGLYSFVFNPVIYALLGTCPQMVVGPEAAGSLLVGSVVRESVDRGHSDDDNSILNAQIAGVVTGMAGAVILIAGLTRLGFLDSVLSRPFLRGFISAIGIVILVDQLIPELGLSPVMRKTHGVDHGSSATKLGFIFSNIGKSHGLTAAVSFGSFFIIMVFRTLKRKLQPRMPSVAYIPDRFLVVVLSALLAWRFRWDEHGLEILGDVKSSGTQAFPFHWPFQFKHIKHIDTAMSTSFLIALLGFFESSVAAKSLGEGTHDLKGMSLSANRELVALGVANLVGGCFMALPAFGGYGRSKVNASTGGRTPMSSIFLSIITLICVLFLLPYFYYIPKGVLSAMISVVAYSLIEECPHDLKFFFQVRGYTELLLMTIIFVATILYSLSLGIALGIGLSILQLIRHSTKPRIQILGKIPGTTDKFENAELSPENIEFIEGCLIVKIPEPLTFANTGELKARLKRLEHYGTNAAHPALPRVRHEAHNQNIIFDVHGVTSIDGSGIQVLTEIVEAYRKKDVRVIFCRLPLRRSKVFRQFELSGIVEMCGGRQHFVESVDEALRLTETEDTVGFFNSHPADGNA